MGVNGVILTSPLWAGLIATAFVPWAGRPVIETAPTGVHFGARHLSGQTRHKTRPSKPRPAGTMALPGDAAALRFHLDISGAVMVHDPHAQTMTAVAHVTQCPYCIRSHTRIAVRKGATEQGKKMGVRDMTSADFAKETDAKMKDAITNGLKQTKDGKAQEMEPYKDKLKPEEIDNLVAYVKSLKK